MRELPTLWREMDRPLTSFGAWGPMLRQLNEIFDVFPGAWDQQMSNTRALVPACDVSETDERYLVSFDMPGMDAKDIDIEVRGNVLTVRGERHVDTSEDNGSSRFVERRFGTFARSMTLPDGIQADSVQANYERGVLNVVIPKAETARPHKVAIREAKAGTSKHLLGGKKERPSEGEVSVSAP